MSKDDRTENSFAGSPEAAAVAQLVERRARVLESRLHDELSKCAATSFGLISEFLSDARVLLGVEPLPPPHLKPGAQLTPSTAPTLAPEDE